VPTTSAEPAASSASPIEASPSAPAVVQVDPGLLEVLPREIDGVPLEADPSTAAEVGADPLLAESATGLVVALAVAPGASDSGDEDLAVASVIRLKPDVFDEAFYQEWRDTYDQAACEVADGVEGVGETSVGGHHVYVGTCAGGAMTYHTYLEDQNFLVSVTATGPREFGLLVMAGLAG
jgi:hypothetical protein